MARPQDSPEPTDQHSTPTLPTITDNTTSVAERLTLRGRRFASHQSVTHLITAARRYSGRLGNQFAGAMTYFSLLSLVPILMVGFAVAGIVLRNNQDLLAELLKRELTVMPAEIADRVSPLIDSVIANPFGIGITGLLIAMFSGICWMRNLRKATAVLWRPTLEQNSQAPHNIIGTTLRDLGALAGLTAVVVLSVGLSAPWDPSSRPRS